MSIVPSFAALAGRWTGVNLLRVSSGEPIRESAASANVATSAGGRFFTMAYTWSNGDTPQDGLIVLGHEQNTDAVTAVWVDSWHMGDALMKCEGREGAPGMVSVRGHYPAPPGPDWGWRIFIDASRPDGTFRMLMYNISPEGHEEWAVEATFARIPPT